MYEPCAILHKVIFFLIIIGDVVSASVKVDHIEGVVFVDPCQFWELTVHKGSKQTVNFVMVHAEKIGCIGYTSRIRQKFNLKWSIYFMKWTLHHLIVSCISC